MKPSNYGMRALAEHYRRCRRRFPDDRLLIVFDIDGTLLKAVPETEPVDCFTRSPQPFPGALETLRWFQMQPDTEIALNTGRLESQRAETLATMRMLGRDYKIHFEDSLLAMNSYGPNERIRAKAEALQQFRRTGYRVVAMVDDQPEIAEALAALDQTPDVMYLLAHRLFAGRRQPVMAAGPSSGRVVAGDGFHFDGLMGQEDVSRRVRLVATRLETRAEMLTFFRSSVEWGRIAVDWGDAGEPVVVGRFPEGVLSLETVLAGINTAMKSISVELMGDIPLVDRVTEILSWYGLSHGQLSFIVDHVSDQTIHHLGRLHPKVCLQRTVDTVVYGPGDGAERWLRAQRALGISRLSVDWALGERYRIAQCLLEGGWEVDVVGADDVDSFLRSILLLPTSVTSSQVLSNWHVAV